MLKSPCASCERLNEPKNEGECVGCDKKYKYAEAIESGAIGAELLKPETKKEPGRISVVPGIPKFPPLPEKKCAVLGCKSVKVSRGLCTKHYQAARLLEKSQGVFRRDPVEAPAPPNKSATIVFTDLLWSRLEEIAAKEYRTPEAQAIYFIHLLVTAYPNELVLAE